MARLRYTDLEAVVDFLGDITGLECEEAYSPGLLQRLQMLIHCDAATYQEYEYDARRDCLMVAIEAEGVYRWETSPTTPADADSETYWRLGPCPIVKYRMERRDLEAVRMSDVISHRRLRELPLYREFFRPHRAEYMLDLGLPERQPRQRSLILFRSNGEADFSERDRAVLETLRPHLAQREALADLRRRLVEAVRGRAGGGEGSVYDALTTREREIVELVGQGKTNAEIATQLWIAPSTVKKHLENVYAKVGVGRRAAAATLLRATR